MAYRLCATLLFVPALSQVGAAGRTRTSINNDWRFWRSETTPDGLTYDRYPNSTENAQLLKPWILPSGNDFLADPDLHHERPSGNLGGDLDYVQISFDDSEWEQVKLPHDWAIKGPFYTGSNPVIGGGMGRLPIHGIGWYRRLVTIPDDYQGKTVYLDIDGAMSHAAVWLNGNLVGGWPFGYNSFRLNLTPYVEYGTDNQLAIRLENWPNSSRWYPGGGIYRNVWLTVTEVAQVSQWGTFITSTVSNQSAVLDLSVQIQNNGDDDLAVDVQTDVHILDTATGERGDKVASFPGRVTEVQGGDKASIKSSVSLKNPRLWGPPPTQEPNLYVAVTKLLVDDELVDEYDTPFGVRSLVFDANRGLVVNGELVQLKGVNMHSDLGALGAAWNKRAAERQLDILAEMGVNSIRMSHNPPAPELLDLADRRGFLVMNEIFDCWARGKTDYDYHLLFEDWHEQDLRAFLRRDRNHPSIAFWSYGNEVSEQGTGEEGAELSTYLLGIVRQEDVTRPATASKNSAKSDSPFAAVLDIISLNYQGSGIRDTVAYSGLDGLRSPPQYPLFHEAFPDKLILGSETGSAVSSRGQYLFPVTAYSSAPANDSFGGDSESNQVSAYELYTTSPGSSADKVWTHQDKNPFVAGEFVWTGFDYLGEPSPYYDARSSYFGIVDLAGFKKNRFWLYQARWRPELRIAHILPHWTWPSRQGEVTPVHVFSEADEAELFLNGESQGRLERGEYEYRFRWDDVVYEPGELYVVTYRDGEEWANSTVRTVGPPSGLRLTADRAEIKADGEDLSFVTVEVVDDDGSVVPEATNKISFSVSGAGNIIATDNGDSSDFTVFPSLERNAFAGLALAIVSGRRDEPGSITVRVESEGLESDELALQSE